MNLITYYLLMCPVSAFGTSVALVYICNIKYAFKMPEISFLICCNFESKSAMSQN